MVSIVYVGQRFRGVSEGESAAPWVLMHLVAWKPRKHRAVVCVESSGAYVFLKLRRYRSLFYRPIHAVVSSNQHSIASNYLEDTDRCGSVAIYRRLHILDTGVSTDRSAALRAARDYACSSWHKLYGSCSSVGRRYIAVDIRLLVDVSDCARSRRDVNELHYGEDDRKQQEDCEKNPFVFSVHGYVLVVEIRFVAAVEDERQRVAHVATDVFAVHTIVEAFFYLLIEHDLKRGLVVPAGHLALVLAGVLLQLRLESECFAELFFLRHFVLENGGFELPRVVGAHLLRTVRKKFRHDYSFASFFEHFLQKWRCSV